LVFFSVQSDFDVAFAESKGDLKTVNCKTEEAWKWVAKKLRETPKFKIWCPVHCALDYDSIVPVVRELCREDIDQKALSRSSGFSLPNGSSLTCVTHGTKGFGGDLDLVVLHDIERFSLDERCHIWETTSKVRKCAFLAWLK
jgi:hypothetical protein